MEVRGKLDKKLGIQSGVSKAGKQWQKLSFVILQETNANFPQPLAIDVFNNPEMTTFINDTDIGTVLKCNINLMSKEFNGRWFTNVTLWKAEVMKEGNEVVVDTPSGDDLNEIARQKMHPEPPKTEDDDDALPF